MTARPADVDADARRRRHIALVAALLLNGTFLAMLDHLMQPGAMRRPTNARHDAVDVLLVRLIDPAPVPVGVPIPAPADVNPPVTAPRPRRGASRASPTQEGAAAQTPRSAAGEGSADDAAADTVLPGPGALRLYDGTGRVLMPAPQKGEGAPAPFPERPRVAQEGNPFVHRNPVPYTPTRLDKYWPSVRETLGGELVRKATVKKAWRTPWGTQVECAWVLFFGGCGWGPEPRATAEELKQMRADPPLPHPSPATDAPTYGPSP